MTRGRILPTRRELHRELARARREAEATRQALRSAMDALDQARRELEAYGRIRAVPLSGSKRVPSTATYGRIRDVAVYGHVTDVSVSSDPGVPS